MVLVLGKGALVLIGLALTGVPATLRVLAAIVLGLRAASLYIRIHTSERTDQRIMSILSTACLQLSSIVFRMFELDVLVEGAFRPSALKREG